MDQREKVMAGTDKLRHTTDVIKQALRTVRLFSLMRFDSVLIESSFVLLLKIGW